MKFSSLVLILALLAGMVGVLASSSFGMLTGIIFLCTGAILDTLEHLEELITKKKRVSR